MNRYSLIAFAATAAAAVLATAPAHATLGAGEGTPGYAHETAAAPAGSLSRSEVRAEAARALAEGRIASGEATPAAAPAGMALPGLTRAQVRAEAAEALRLGLLASGEAAVVYTAPQLAALQAVVERTDAFVVAGRR
jgi:hypothetical protein